MSIRTKYYDFLETVDEWLENHPKLNEVINDFELNITYPFTHLRFLYETKYLPKHSPHYFCTFKDPYHGGRVTRGWFVRNRKGRMIPWVHFVDSERGNAMICFDEYQVKVEG